MEIAHHAIAWTAVVQLLHSILISQHHCEWKKDDFHSVKPLSFSENVIWQQWLVLTIEPNRYPLCVNTYTYVIIDQTDKHWRQTHRINGEKEEQHGGTSAAFSSRCPYLDIYSLVTKTCGLSDTREINHSQCLLFEWRGYWCLVL